MNTNDKNSKKQGEKEMEVEISNEYVASKKEYWDSYSVVTTSYNKGRAEGREEGREEERQKNVQEKLESAHTLKANGVPLEVIVKSLHLTDDEAAMLRS